MAVQPDRTGRAAPDPWALDALAEAGRAAARGGRLGDVAQAIAEAAADAARAPLVVARISALDRTELVTRGVASDSAVLAAELEGMRTAAEGWPDDEASLDDAPDAVRALARRAGVDRVLVVPIVAEDGIHGSLEVYGAESDGGETAARLAAAQLGLAIHALDVADERAAAAVGDALRVAGEALAAGGDVARAESNVLRLALELAHADGATLWRLDGDGGPVLSATVGSVEGGPPPSAGVRDAGETWRLTEPLGDPAFGLLELVFRADRVPRSELVLRLREFALRAAHTLRVAERTRALESELDRTRALLAVVGQASAQLSLSHALDTAIERVSDLAAVDRLAIYLLDDGRLSAAAERGLAGPHTRVAEALLELALGAFRGRGLVTLEDAAADRRLEGVSDALAEAGIESAVALPLVAGDTVIGLLAVYPSRGQVPGESEIALLSALADRLAVAVENARLHEQATRLGQELEQVLASERAAARQLGALYEISRSFAQSLSLEVTLQSVARTAVELLEVDAAVLRMPDPRREQLLPVAMYAGEERLIEPIRAMLYRPQPLVGAMRRLFRTGEPIFLDAETAESVGGSQSLLAPFLAKGSTAAIVPVATPSEVLASLSLISLAPDRPIGRETVDAALAVGGQAALAIDNARLYQQQKDFADAMQRSLLPQVRPAVAGLDIGEVYASSAHVEVGGDLYDYITVGEGRLAVVLGDVTGHGIDAAADMAMAKFVFRSLAREHPEPAEFLAAANDVVVGEIASGKFITMLYLLIDPLSGTLACASAGHPPPRLIGDDGEVRSIDARGLALGVDSGAEYDEVREQLALGEAVVLYTDGVIEARRSGELYGMDRLDALLARRHALRAEDIAASVIQAARRFAGGELLDDCAVVVLKRTP